MRNKKILSLTLILIFLVSFVIRILWMGNYFGQDEIHYVGLTSDILKGKPVTSTYPLVFEYFLAPFILISGESEIVIHTLMTVISSISVLILFYIGKKLFNFWVGLIAAILLMFNTTYWFFSQFAMLDIPAMLFATLGICFFWVGYKKKSDKNSLLGSIATSIAVGIRHLFFPSLAMLGYLLFFDRKKLFNKKLILLILIPLIIFGIWLFFFFYSGIFNWWMSYLRGELGYNQSYYFYLERIFDEFLLPSLTLFVLFLSSYLIASKYKFFKSRIVKISFFIIFILISIYFLPKTSLTFQEKSILGLLTFVMLFYYQFRKSDVNKFLIIYIAIIFIFFSIVGVKIARYVLSALPALYLLVAQLFYDVRKSKILVVISIAVLGAFVVLNSLNTVDKLKVDKEINEVKFEVQEYVKDNSKACSQVYSKTWYGFYYLRGRITDIPDNRTVLEDRIKIQCVCPPEYILSEGVSLDYFGDIVSKEKESDKFNIYVYRINSTAVKELCSKNK